MSKQTIAQALAVELTGGSDEYDASPQGTIARLRSLAVSLSRRMWEMQTCSDETLARTLVDSAPVYDAGETQ